MSSLRFIRTTHDFSRYRSIVLTVRLNQLDNRVNIPSDKLPESIKEEINEFIEKLKEKKEKNKNAYISRVFIVARNKYFEILESLRIKEDNIAYR